jgi:hypothetical protein
MSHRPYCGSELGGSCTCGKPKDAHTGWQDKLDDAARLLTEIIGPGPVLPRVGDRRRAGTPQPHPTGPSARRSGAGHGKAS